MLARLADYDNLITGGRQGLFRYIFLDAAMEMGQPAARQNRGKPRGQRGPRRHPPRERAHRSARPHRVSAPLRVQKFGPGRRTGVLSSTMQRLAPLGLLLLGACLEINPGGSDAGAAAASPAQDAATGAEAATSSGCAHDSVAGVTLCTAVSLCPGLAVDHDLYPHCGFRSRAIRSIWSAFAATTFAPWEPLSAASRPPPCSRRNRSSRSAPRSSEGRCAARSSPPAPATGCDRTCESECGGSPGCIQACGC